MESVICEVRLPQTFRQSVNRKPMNATKAVVIGGRFARSEKGAREAFSISKVRAIKCLLSFYVRLARRRERRACFVHQIIVPKNSARR